MLSRHVRPLAFLSLIAGVFFAPMLSAQPVFSADDFSVVYAHPHTLTSYGVGNPNTFAELTRLTGGPHVFDLTAAQLVTGAAQTITPVRCAPTVPGCGQTDLAPASLVLRTHEHDDVYLFHDLADDGFYLRGSAGEVVDATSGTALEGALTFESADQTLALPLRYPLQWTSGFSTHLATGAERTPLNTVINVRDVVAWGTLRTAHGEAGVLVVHEHRITTTQVDGQALRDTSHAYRFISPRLRATLSLAADGSVESASIDVFDVTATDVAEEEAPPLTVQLHAPFPNPAREAAMLSFTLDAAAPVTLDVFDLLGRRVLRLAEGLLPAGTHTRTWEAEVPSGTYFVHLRAGAMTLTRSVTLVE